MALRGLIIGILVWLFVTVVAGDVAYSQSEIAIQAAHDIIGKAFRKAVEQSIEQLKSETDRLAIRHILDELDTKSNREILVLKLAPDICRAIACGPTVSPDTAHRYVAAYADERVADDAHQTALRNAAAAERSTLIAAMAASVSLLSLLISGLSYRRTGRSTKSAIPA